MALQDYLEQFVHLLPDGEPVPDGYGGKIITYVGGPAFMAAITPGSSARPVVAEQDTLSVTYNIVCPDYDLRKDDRVQRMIDGTIFTILTDANDMRTPSNALMQYTQVTAKRVEITS